VLENVTLHDYINPFVKVLIAKRNKFRHRGIIAAAEKLTCAISNIIANIIRSLLRKLANTPVKEMWSNNSVRHPLADVVSVNKYFASISFAYNERPNFVSVTPTNFQKYAFTIHLSMNMGAQKRLSGHGHDFGSLYPLGPNV
jgi:hypothetical protein